MKSILGVSWAATRDIYMAENPVRQKDVKQLFSGQRGSTIMLLIALLGAQMTTQSSEKPSRGKVVFVIEIINNLLLHKRFMYQFNPWLFLNWWVSVCLLVA